MGGLGNQMFQYAAGKALSIRNKSDFYVDTYSGFYRDKIYKRTYELNFFNITVKKSGFLNHLRYLIEKLKSKIFDSSNKFKNSFFLWTSLIESELSYSQLVFDYKITGNTWMHGYWQSEKYFHDISNIISKEFMPPTPTDSKFLHYAELIDSNNSICLGVRLFQEVPGASKDGIGGLTSMSFFNNAAKKISEGIKNPEFFIFCNINAPELDELNLPGKVHFITHDNGFNGTFERLWLFSRSRKCIISNSSFYWWGAWLAENRNKGVKIISSNNFTNSDTIPKRWETINQ